MPNVSDTAALYSITHLTYDDYALFPDDGRRHEILNGQHVMSPAPRTVHQRLVLDIASELRTYLRKYDAGEVFIAPFDVVLSEFNIVQPDICVVLAYNMEIVDDANCKGAPNLIVEVLSQSTRRRDLVDKRTAYERAGVDEYWIVDPDAGTLDVLWLGENGRYEEPERLSAAAGDCVETAQMILFSLDLADLFG